MTDDEKAILTMISASGDSKAKAFSALKLVMTNDYEGARNLLEEARVADLEAHKTQANLIANAMNKDNSDVQAISLLMVHAQDHYMTSQLARDLIEELINVFEEKEIEIEEIKK